jgi:ABC-type multidrug transport system permease subunit
LNKLHGDWELMSILLFISLSASCSAFSVSAARGFTFGLFSF